MRTDEELARAFGDGDDQALATLYDRYRRTLFAFCARMLGQGEEARDIVQDVFAGLYERRDEYSRVRSVRSWLFTVSRNRCLSAIRRSRNHARLAQAIPDGPPAMSVTASLESADDVQRVRSALAELAPDHREVLLLREYQDLSYREIAEITESTESAVKSRLFRARQALSERLRPACSQGDTPCGAKIEDRR